MSKGRTVPVYRPGRNRRGDVTIPACDLTLPDGRILVYAGFSPPRDAGGILLRIAFWRAADSLQVGASIDPLPHAGIDPKRRYLHLSIARADRYPEWDEQIAIVETIAGRDLDMAMIKPRRADYISPHAYCFHWWELPVEWGIR